MIVSVWEFSKIVLPYGRTDGWLCMLRAYLDDSGTHKDAPVVVIGGLIGLTDQWDKLEQTWSAKLAVPMPGKPPLRAFHLSHLIGHHGEFRDYRQAEIDLLRHDFRQIILDSNLRQLSLAISRSDWDELVVPPYREFMGSAEEACFAQFVDFTLGFVRAINNPKLKIAYIYDIGRKTPQFEKLIGIINDQQYRPEIASVSWGKVEDMPPLQAADFIANENYRAVQEWSAAGDLTNTSAHLKRLLGGMAGDGLILDREAIQAELNRRGLNGKLR